MPARIPPPIQRATERHNLRLRAGERQKVRCAAEGRRELVLINRYHSPKVQYCSHLRPSVRVRAACQEGITGRRCMIVEHKQLGTSHSHSHSHSQCQSLTSLPRSVLHPSNAQNSCFVQYQGTDLLAVLSPPLWGPAPGARPKLPITRAPHRAIACTDYAIPGRRSSGLA